MPKKKLPDLIEELETILLELRCLQNPVARYAGGVERYVVERLGITLPEFLGSKKYSHKQIRTLIFVALSKYVDNDDACEFLRMDRFARIYAQKSWKELINVNKKIGNSYAVVEFEKIKEYIK